MFRPLLLVILLLATGLPVATPALAQEEMESSWRVSSHAGALLKTVDDTAMILALQLDIPLRGRLNLGGYGVAASSRNLLEYGLALTAKLRIQAGSIGLEPFAGLGFLKADYDTDAALDFTDSSTGLFIPLGLTLPFVLGGQDFALSGVLHVHSLDFEVGPGRDRGSVAVLLGVRM